MTCRNRSSHLSVNGDALPGVSNRTRPVRLSLRRFKSRIQVRDELMQQIEAYGAARRMAKRTLRFEISAYDTPILEVLQVWRFDLIS
jgi:hypothetical protein